MNTFVQNIKAGMAYLNLSSKDMAKACKVSRATWFRWLSDPGSITLNYLSIIAAKLGVKPAELLEERTEYEA